MTTRRTILSHGLAAILAATTPLAALARTAGNAGGNGNGGNGNGGGRGGNNGGGNSGGGNKGGGNNGKGGADTGGKAPGAAPAAGSVPDATRRYRNGMTETVRNGRYEMRDARGRSIVNRPATQQDVRRIRGG